jgi:hypothetical protein
MEFSVNLGKFPSSKGFLHYTFSNAAPEARWGIMK